MHFFRQYFFISVTLLFGSVRAFTQDDPTTLTIEDLVSQVMAANPELAIYQAELEAARGERFQAGRWSNPEFSLEIGRQKIRDLTGTSEGAVWSASVAQPIEFPGRLALRKAIADRNIELAELGVQNLRSELARQVRNLGYALYRTRATAEAYEQVTSRARALTEVLLQRDVGGVSPLLESRILESGTIRLEQRRQEAWRAHQRVLIQLNQLRDLPAETPLRLAEPTLDLPDLPEIHELVAAAWQNAFEARARMTELEQQGFRVQLERNARYPTVTAGPYISQERAGERETVAGIAVSFPLPVWDRNTGNLQSANARLRQAEASIRVMRRELERRVVENALSYKTARDSIAQMRPETLEELQFATDLAERHFRLGAIPVNTYLDMQNAYLDALDALLSLRQEALESRRELELLTGQLAPSKK